MFQTACFFALRGIVLLLFSFLMAIIGAAISWKPIHQLAKLGKNKYPKWTISGNALLIFILPLTVRRQRQRRHRSNSRLWQSCCGKTCRIRCSRKSACSKFANSKQKTSPASSKQKIGRQQKCTLCRWSHLQQWHMRARVSTCSLPTENEINP